MDLKDVLVNKTSIKLYDYKYGAMLDYNCTFIGLGPPDYQAYKEGLSALLSFTEKDGYLEVGTNCDDVMQLLPPISIVLQESNMDNGEQFMFTMPADSYVIK